MDDATENVASNVEQSVEDTPETQSVVITEVKTKTEESVPISHDQVPVHTETHTEVIEEPSGTIVEVTTEVITVKDAGVLDTDTPMEGGNELIQIETEEIVVTTNETTDSNGEVVETISTVERTVSDNNNMESQLPPVEAWSSDKLNHDASVAEEKMADLKISASTEPISSLIDIPVEADVASSEIAGVSTSVEAPAEEVSPVTNGVQV